MTTEKGSKQINAADSPQGKSELLRVLRNEAEGFFKLVVDADEKGWLAETPCEGWQVRDIVGHMTDVSETYLGRYVLSMEGWPAPDPLGLRGYAKAIDEGARAQRSVPQYELIGRQKAAWDGLNRIWDGLSDDQWAGLNIHHKFAGPVPQFMMNVFQLMDYTYHSWDIRKALGQEEVLGDEGAGYLVPFMIMLRQFTFASEKAEGLDITVGIDVNGPYGGTWKLGVKDGQLSVEEGDISGSQAVISFKDHVEFCLDAYGRAPLGAVEGDESVANTFKGLFFSL